MVNNFENSFEFRNEAPKILTLNDNKTGKADKIQTIEPGSISDMESAESSGGTLHYGDEKTTIRDDVFSHFFHITDADSNVKYADVKNDVNSSKYNLKSGRPDFKTIFNDLATLCEIKGVGRVAVVACGPSNLVEQVTFHCSRRIQGVAFDLHRETFDL